MKKFPLLALLAAVLAAASMHGVIRAEGQLVPGRNINLHPGAADQFVGDKYLQRDIESKIVCTIPHHCVMVENNYSTVDGAADLVSGFGEGNATASAMEAFLEWAGVKTHRAAGPPDAWLGLQRMINEHVSNGLVPGFPADVTALGAVQPWLTYAAASDGDLATDGTHIYGTGMFFDRGGKSLIGAFRLTDFNDESPMPIRWDAGASRIIDQRPGPSDVSFLDLPSIAVDPTPRPGNAPGCGNVYIGYTAFTGFAGNSEIKVVRSTDCGATYSMPKKINGIFAKNQRVVFAVDPRPGTPLSGGGGRLYAVWRTFSPDMIVGAVSLDFGKNWSPAVPYSVLNGVSTLCKYDQPTVGTTNNMGDPNNETARAVAFPTMAIDSNGRLHLAWTERVKTNGEAATGSACQTSLQPKIVYTMSSTGGLLWTPRKAIDKGRRCETMAGVNQPGGLDRSQPNGTTCLAGTQGRPSGPQMQPVLVHNAGKLMLMYREGRGGLTAGGPAAGYHSGRNTQMDQRAARINPANGALQGTTQMSVYTYSAATNDIKTIDGSNPPAKAYNRPYLPQYKGGTAPFMGDHDGMAAAEGIVWDSPAHFPTAAEVPGTRFLGIWGGDNREALFPGGNLNASNLEWRNYGFPGCNAGIRNSNSYIASVGGITEAFALQSFKPTDVLQQRTWVVTVRNRSDSARAYKLALDERNGASNGSLDQFNDVTVIGNTDGNAFCSNAAYPGCTAYRVILPNSSMSFTVFGTILNPAVGGPMRVNVYEATVNSAGTAVTGNTLAAIVRLNPNPNNPTPTLADPSAFNSESHGPSVAGPEVTTYGNPTPGNPTPGNSTLAFPTPGNPTPGNPTPGNPTPGNAGFGEYTDYSYEVAATSANTSSQYAAFADIPSPDLVDKSHFVQMIITRPTDVPALDLSQAGCPEILRPEDDLVSIINAPTPGNLGVPTPGNPTPGNPTPGNTTTANPTPGNPTPGNNTFALPPANAPLGAVAFSATALAAASVIDDGTLVAPPKFFKARVTVRFWHCTQPNATDSVLGPICLFGGKKYLPETETTLETVPKSNATGGNQFITATFAPGSGDNDGGTITPPEPVIVAPLSPSSLLPVCGDQSDSSAEAPCDGVGAGSDFALTPSVQQVFKVPGTGPQDVRFDFVYRGGAFINELVVFRVDAANGRIGALLPGDPGYLAAAFAYGESGFYRATVVFPSGSCPGFGDFCETESNADVTLPFTGGDFLAFALIQNQTVSNWRYLNPDNLLTGSPLAFFSISSLNPDGINHSVAFQSQSLDLTEYAFEDLTGGGDSDFEDMVFTVSVVPSEAPIPHE